MLLKCNDLSDHWLVAQCFQEGTFAQTVHDRPESVFGGRITEVFPDGHIRFSRGVKKTRKDDINFVFAGNGIPPLRAQKGGESGQVLMVFWRPETDRYPATHSVLFVPDGKDAFIPCRFEDLTP